MPVRRVRAIARIRRTGPQCLRSGPARQENRATEMSGNVREWCAYWHEANAPACWKPDATAQASTGSCRCLHGGSWDFAVITDYIRCARRFHDYPTDYRNDFRGFRCARTVL